MTPLIALQGRTRAVALASATTLLAAAAVFPRAGAAADTYPSQPIRIEVPFGPGGVADISMRIVAQKMSESMGTPVVVENRPSAGQTVASTTVAKAAPDGYMLLLLSQGNSVSMSLFKKLPYDPVKDFAPISTMGFFGLALVVDGQSPIHTLDQFVAAAKAKPDSFNIGTTSVGSTQYISAELLKSIAGLPVPTVPFSATPMIFTALEGHDIQGMMEMLAPLMPQIRSGKVRALGVSFNHRFSGLPEVPTLAEAGASGYESSAWNGLAAPAKTPRPIIERLNAEIRKAIALPDVIKRFENLGIDPRASSPEELGTLLITEAAKWKAVIEKAHIPQQ
jgi:tripartite-type tricarboxylate transporter receptor subunit TctC